MEVEKCVICGLIMMDDDVLIVKERGLLKFIESSIERDDGKADCFKDRAELKLHRTCRHTYNNPKCIEAVKRRKKKESEEVSQSIGEFDFENKCLFCTKDASLEFQRKQSKYPLSSRISVAQVKLDTQNTILQACTTRDDDWSKEVLLRIDEVNILEKNAKYHSHCYSKFCHLYRGFGDKPGRKPNASVITMDQDYEFIEGTKMEVEKCVICGLVLGVDILIVKERGLLKFIESSIERDDGKADCFMDNAELKLHRACRITYNNPKCIEAEKKRKKKESEEVSQSTGEFDFENKCLFCTKDVSLEFQKKSRNALSSKVCQMKKLDTQNTILQACTTHDDDWSKEVLLRIDEVNILEKNARYHYQCYSKFCNSYRAFGGKPGRKPNASVITMDQDFEFIEVTKSRKIATIDQLNSLVEFMQQHPRFANNKLGRSPEGTTMSVKLWEELSQKLNALGASRSSKEWAKYWCDYKSRTRRKALDIKMGSQQNSDEAVGLTELEESVIQLIGLPTPEVIVKNDPLFEEDSDEDADADFDAHLDDALSLDQISGTRSPVQEVFKRETRSVARKRRHSSREREPSVEDSDGPSDSKTGLTNGARNSTEDKEAAAFLRLEREKLESTNRLTEAVHDVRAEVSRLADVLTQIKDVIINKLNI